MATIIILGFQNCFVFIFFFIFSLFCYYLFFKKPSGSRRGCDLPPSPPYLPVIGHIHLLLSTDLTHKSLQKLSFKYGSLIRLRILNIPIVLVSSASVAYEIFKTHDVNISSRGPPLIDESLFLGSWSFITAPYGDHWKFMKKVMVTKLFGSQALERSRGVREEEVERFYASLLDKARKKESVDIAKETMKLSINIICKMIAGKRCSEENGEAEKARGLASESFSLGNKLLLGAMLRAPFRKLVLSLFKKEMMVVSSRFDELLERILREYEEKLDEHQSTDFMDALLATYRDENAEHKMSRNHIKSVFTDLLFAGTDTTMQTTQWAMAEIINKPNVLERLREEIDLVVGKTRLIQETDLQNLPYLQAVVKEVLRLHPTGPLYARFSQDGCRIGGFYVPENTPLVVNLYAMMRDPKYWDDPNEFKPERFLLASSRSGQQDDERREKTLEYIPFGGGRRGCPAENLAYLFLETTVGMMVQGFEWRMKGEKVNMEEAVKGLTLTMAHPPKFTPIARTLNPLTLNLQDHNV